MSSYTSTVTTPTRRAAAYIRVSPEKSKGQTEFFEGYIRRRGETLVNAYCDEGISANDEIGNRTGLDNMLKAAKKREFDILYVKDVARLYRNMPDFINLMSELKRNGVTVHFLDTGCDADELILSIYARAAQMAKERH